MSLMDVWPQGGAQAPAPLPYAAPHVLDSFTGACLTLFSLIDDVSRLACIA
jgi:hypothetical protein